ncbi:MAG: stage II sporulation protein P [Thermoanaerobacteraceae bacterium]|nr:stage II sporulation protein P [Thermoanaerobacteraceae bacterium]
MFIEIKNNNYLWAVMLLLILLINSITSPAYADEWYGESEKYYSVYIENEDKPLFMTAWEIALNDEYLSSDNKLYRITKIDSKNYKAYAKHIKDIKLPEIDISDIKETTAQQASKKIGLLSTHSDESYLPSDGKASINGRGGIYDVDEALRKSLENNGIDVTLDKSLYLPHDAKAYSRSRSGVLNLVKDGAEAIFDIHRDAVPPEEYVREIDGKNAAGIRIVIGRANPNKDVNANLAYKMKAVGDKLYPGMVKDIFFGHGSYNQDIGPNVLLLEFGTHTIHKERAEVSATMFADVISKALYGTNEKKEKTPIGLVKSTPDQRSASTKNIIILLVVTVIGIGGFVFLSMGGKEWKSKIGNYFTGYLGKLRKK